MSIFDPKFPESIYTEAEQLDLMASERDHYRDLLGRAKHLIESDECEQPCRECEQAEIALGYRDAPATTAE